MCRFAAGLGCGLRPAPATHGATTARVGAGSACGADSAFFYTFAVSSPEGQEPPRGLGLLMPEQVLHGLAFFRDDFGARP